MLIIGSQTSPFTRFVRVICEELALPYEMEVTLPFAKMDAKQDAFLRAHNPVMKVPILIDGDKEIIDSRIIGRYLLRQRTGDGPFTASYFDDLINENILTVMHGMLDAGILRFILRTSHPEINAGGGYMARSMTRIQESLAWLECQTSLGQRFDVAEAFLVCAFEWFKKRNICTWDRHPRLTKIHTDFVDRSSFVKTRIPDAL